jgi:hypothetical protein
MRRVDLCGRRFGFLTVLGDSPVVISPSGQKTRVLRCRCDFRQCRTVCEVRYPDLLSGRSTSCGCYHRYRITTHDLTKTGLPDLHRKILDRCYNPASGSFAYYGGRGIGVCSEWRGKKGLKAFAEWSLSRADYVRGRWIDRIDNDADYSPTNCRWVTPLVSNSNRRCTVRMPDGMPFSDYWRSHNSTVEYSLALARYRRLGWTAEEAVR